MTEPRIDVMQNELGAKLAKRLFAVHNLLQQTGLPHATQNLVMLRASQINGCGHCIDIHAKEAAAEGETTTRLNLVAGWRHSTVFTEEEQAALALTEEATRLADASEGVTDETWARAAKYYDDNQLIALVTLIAMINATNRMAVTFNQAGGSYEPGLMSAAING
ncbi:carboxymuconolactone decarboxylase family protein [Kribbella jiaozuonensis]|uniref:Carboxymuconolactone decarboxylase family protein n=1 Tax=Kribbella jiaozuonensis TaxID=2575441 RepID=A0A4U3LS08_9ACTN|nr:carboxymuconolactone decarboxylase family protein [Kribbella jiaozuonensis]TKK78209.1 carboxymuconolactone decarboxylase family protein [Kribbella jiaozuonensis]